VRPNGDLFIYDRKNRLAALVDVRARRGTSREWAAELRRNLRQREGFRGAPILLVVTLDHIYLWPEADTAPDLALPAYEIEAGPVLNPYLAGTSLDLGTLGREAFELLVSAWLSALVHSLGTAPHDQHGLADSGFLEAVRNGRLYDLAAA
jgi:hypothetical protein